MLPPAEHALLAFARKLTLSPATIVAHDVDELRAHGWGDAEISHAVQVIAMFNYYNRIADGLGIRTTDDGG